MKNIFYSLLLIYSVTLNAQRGQLSTDTIRVSKILNEYTALTVDAISGSTILQVADHTLNANHRFSEDLKAGDLLFIIQMQGAQIETSNDINWGKVTAYNGAGNQEWAEVHSVTENGLIQLNCGLKHTYLATGRSQVVRVPRYQHLNISTGGIIAAENWNGLTGGIVALECEGTLLIESGGKVDASGAGFRGGRAINNNPDWSIPEYVNSLATRGAEKGESIVGFDADYQALGGKYCRGATANGGGGGNAHNCGGGGGANGGLLAGWDGMGNPDTSVAGWAQAWELESAGFSKHRSEGGGRGGYSFSGVNKDPLVAAPNSEVWNGDWRRNYGGLGGRPLEDAGFRLFAGGGGGAGDANNNAGGSGGTGGGIIAIRCFGSLNGTGSIWANGNAGGNAGGGSVNGKDGAGGGGGGGSIMLELPHPANGINIEARGGIGGNQYVTAFIYEAEGPGGGGGGGRVFLPEGSNTPNVNGGGNGTTNSWAFTRFLPNGATAGGMGSWSTQPLLSGISATTDSLCGAGMATLIAEPSANQDYFWTAYPGGEILAVGDTFRVFVSSDTTFYLSRCATAETIPVKYTFSTEILEVNAGVDTSVCAGQAFQLSGWGNGSMQWSGPGISIPSGPTPVIFPQEDSWYVLTVRNKYGCQNSDSVKISVIERIPVNPQYEQISNFEVRFYADSTEINSYVWMLGDSVLCIGNNCVYDFPFDGHYQVSMIVSDFCGKDTVIFPIQVVKITSNGQKLIPGKLEVFPNPANETLYIKPTGNNILSGSYRIFDSFGRLVKTGTGNFKEMNSGISISSLSDGLYWLEIRTVDYIYRSGFIRQSY